MELGGTLPSVMVVFGWKVTVGTWWCIAISNGGIWHHADFLDDTSFVLYCKMIHSRLSLVLTLLHLIVGIPRGC